jgi:hypothetical protein
VGALRGSTHATGGSACVRVALAMYACGTCQRPACILITQITYACTRLRRGRFIRSSSSATFGDSRHHVRSLLSATYDPVEKHPDLHDSLLMEAWAKPVSGWGGGDGGVPWLLRLELTCLRLPLPPRATLCAGLRAASHLLPGRPPRARGARRSWAARPHRQVSSGGGVA